MKYSQKNYDSLVGIEGFSEQLLKNHFVLYQGYVTNAQKISDALIEMERNGKSSTPEYAELKRRFAWEFNGMRLHELYFENITKNINESKIPPRIKALIENDFGSFDEWANSFKTTGLIRGIGWVILYYDPSEKRLYNAWINEHDSGHLACCTPLLIMDMFEHAFMLDYGLKKADYIKSFFAAIDWQAVEFRLPK
ncbi:MAG: Fe-Mn family superoxide dismutase [Candidatus Woesearchaeota archaeon]